MKLINETPFAIGYLRSQLHHPAHALSVVVKGTFHLVPNAPAREAETQLPLGGDVPDEDEAASSLVYPLDLVPFKPKADLMLVGRCHAGPRPVARCVVSFGVGAWSKSLAVWGDRRWTQDRRLTEPEAFTEMQLCYERSFGSPASPTNPVGRGANADPSAPGIVLPNFEDPQRPIRHAADDVPPAGFGPLRPHWSPRKDKLGTYDAAWEAERWPWFPVNFQLAHFNAAPADMQVPYLRGDEALRFTGLHPTQSELASALPGQRVRCFVQRVATPGTPPDTLHELRMELDTLWVDMQTQTLVLLWRGVFPLRTDDPEQEVGELVAAREPLASDPAPIALYAARLAARRVAPTPPAAETPPEPAPEAEDPADAQEAAETEAKAAAAAAQAGLDSAALSAEPSEAEQEAERTRLAALGFGDDGPAPEPPWTRARVVIAIRERRSLAGAQLAGLDLSELDLSGMDLGEATLSSADLKRARLMKARLDGALLEGADLTEADLSEASLARVDLTAATLVRVNLTRALLESAVAEGADLRGARMHAVRAKKLRARGVDLRDSTCTEGDFSAADLGASKLERADLRCALLRAASLLGARADKLDAREADLRELRAADGASFREARLEGAHAEASNWEGADLVGSDFSLAYLQDANLSGAKLDRARLVGADLRQAKLIGASLHAAQLQLANFFEASLESADLNGADLSGASLFAAETWKASLRDAVLTGANLTRTKLAPREPSEEPGPA